MTEKRKNTFSHTLTHSHILEALVLVLGLVPLEDLYHSLWILLLLGLADVRVLQHQVPVFRHSRKLARCWIKADVEGVLKVGRRRDDGLFMVMVVRMRMTTLSAVKPG